MSFIPCDKKYEKDLADYTEQVLKRYGTSSEASQREVMYLSDAGNIVATKYCADLIFYGRILRTNPYRDSFNIYLKAAGIEAGMIRFSVGLEDIDDIMEDIEQAFAKVD